MYKGSLGESGAMILHFTLFPGYSRLAGFNSPNTDRLSMVLQTPPKISFSDGLLDRNIHLILEKLIPSSLDKFISGVTRKSYSLKYQADHLIAPNSYSIYPKQQQQQQPNHPSNDQSTQNTRKF